jgi:hypothetical protein
MSTLKKFVLAAGEAVDFEGNKETLKTKKLNSMVLVRKRTIPTE